MKRRLSENRCTRLNAVSVGNRRNSCTLFGRIAFCAIGVDANFSCGTNVEAMAALSVSAKSTRGPARSEERGRAPQFCEDGLFNGRRWLMNTHPKWRHAVGDWSRPLKLRADFLFLSRPNVQALTDCP